MNNYRLLTGLGLLFLVVIFTIQNAAIVKIWFLFWTFSISRALLLFLVLSVGVLLGWFLNTMITRARQNKEK